MAPADDGAIWRIPLSWRGLQERDPAAYAKVQTGLLVWTWVAIPVIGLGVLTVDGLRDAAPPWLWCYLILLQVFLVCRTKTVTWRFATLAFTAGILLAPVTALIELIVASMAGVAGDDLDRAVLVAAPVEETVKLLPLLVLVLWARNRLASFAVTDYLLLGAAVGLGVQVVEDSLRRLPPDVELFGTAGLADTAGEPHYGWSWLPGWSAAGDAVFGGHHVGTALVLVGVGLALRGSRRLGPAVWALPVLLFAMVLVDHALYNQETFDPSVTSGGSAPVPGWLRTVWEVWGAGGQERPLLALLLVVALVADTRRTRWVWRLLPAIPEPRVVTSLRRWSLRAAVSLRHWPPQTAPAPVRVLAGAGAGALRWLGYAAADILGELILLTVAATSRPPRDSPYAAGRHRRSRWVRTIVGLRMRRDFAQRIAREVGRSGLSPTRLPSFALAALACSLLGLAVAAALAPALVRRPAAAEPVSASAAAVTEAFRSLGDWWAGQGLLAQAMAVLTAAALLTLVSAGLVPDTGDRGPVASAEELVNHPGRVLAGYLTRRTPGETAGYLVEYLVARLVPARMDRAAPRMRGELDELVTSPVPYARAEATLHRRLDEGEAGSAPRRAMPEHISSRLRAGKRTQTGRRGDYPQHPIILDHDMRFDAYLPYRAIASRKYSQLGLVEPETAIGHLNDALCRFTPGEVLVDTPYNRSNFRTLVGTKLRGEIRLEAPIQEVPIPPEVLAAADQLGVVIVDEAGTVYNP